MAVKLRAGMQIAVKGNGNTLRSKIFAGLIQINNRFNHPGLKDPELYKFSHIRVIKKVNYRDGVVLISEALEQGVDDEFGGKPNKAGIKGLAELAKKGQIEILESPYPENYSGFQKALEEIEGVRYGWFKIAGIGITTISNIIKPVLPLKYLRYVNAFMMVATNTTGVICSQLGTIAFKHLSSGQLKINEHYNKKEEFVTPMEIVMHPKIKRHKRIQVYPE